MKAVVYDRFWHSMGGGERHAGMIAQILSRSGVQVDLLGHREVSISELGSRLALDLSATTLRVVPDRGEEAVAELSEEYDLFLNATYMSRVPARAAHSAYLCFFPTPFDHDLSPVHRAATKLVGPYVQLPESRHGFRHGNGWYPPEGGRRRRWTWSNGSGRLILDPGAQLSLEADFGRPGCNEPVQVRVELDDGTALAAIEVGPEFVARSISVPASDQPRIVRFGSKTFQPGPGDERQLGFALSRLRIQGDRYTVAERVGERFPWLTRNAGDLSFLQCYDLVLANSVYTQDWISTLWNRKSEVLFPPIEVQRMAPQDVRQKTILSVGRFFAPGYGHSKRQLEMVQMFGELVRGGQLSDWKLVVIGGCEESQRPYLDKVRAAAVGLPVEIHDNAPRSLVESQMSSAAIFWSATGLGENTEKRPWTNEHFGMTTAEAMAGGCVPVVIDRAGQREIVREGVDGFRWAEPRDCRIRTAQLAADEALRQRMSLAARKRVEEFSDAVFATRWQGLAESYRLMSATPGQPLP